MQLLGNTIPIFGFVHSSTLCRARTASYCVVKDNYGRVAVVESKSGYLFLPGGGSLDGESAVQTLEREIREELARDVHIIIRLGEAIQYFQADGTAYRMEATFFAAELGSEVIGVGEHELLWVTAHEAEKRFFHQCHAWAISL